MGIYRKQIEIVGDILYAAEELTIDQNGASITRLIQKANISQIDMFLLKSSNKLSLLKNIFDVIIYLIIHIPADSKCLL